MYASVKKVQLTGSYRIITVLFCMFFLSNVSAAKAGFTLLETKAKEQANYQRNHIFNIPCIFPVNTLKLLRAVNVPANLGCNKCRLAVSQSNSKSVANLNAAQVNGMSFGSLQPIDIINFIVVQKGEIIVLNWSTANELNDGSFAIEYSRNGAPFTAVGRLTSMGKTLSIQNDYTYQYTGFSTGISSFRLTLTDVNGLVKHSETVVVRVKENGNLTVFPNPASQQVTLRFDNGWTSKPAVIQLLKSTGEVVLLKEVTALKWAESIEVSQLVSGNYLIQVICNGTVITKAVKIQHD